VRVSPIQDSFQRGFIGRRIRGRTQIDAYKQGLRLCENWHPLVQGPIRLRQGSKFIEAVDPDNWPSGQVGVSGIRVFTFQRGLDDDVIVEVGDTDIIVRNSVTGEVITGGNTGNLVSDPLFDNVTSAPVQSADWDTNETEYTAGTDPGIPQDDTCSGSIATIYNGANGILLFGHLHFSPGGWRGPSIGNTAVGIITLPAGSELLVNEFKFKYNQRIYNDEESVLGGAPWTDPVIRVNIGTTKGASNVFTTDIPIGPFTVDNEVVINFTPGGGNNSLYFTIGYAWPNASPFLDITTVGCHDDVMQLQLGRGDPISWIAPLAGGSGSAVEFVSPYSADQLECLQFAMDPGEQVMYFFHPEVETMRLRFANGEWTFEALSAITLPSVFVPPTPNLWVAGNFPSCGTIHEGRLWLAATPGQPATLWASRSGDYQDFNQAAPSAQDDPLEFPLSSVGNIQTLTSRKELVINTDISEVVGTSQQGVIAFDDFSFPKQTDWGSNCVQPIVVGRDMVYTSNSRTRVRTFADEGGTNFGWDGNELSLLAQELFGSPVRRMVYLDEPAYQACFLLADGTMAMATYFYPEDVIGWWLYRTAYNGNRTYGDDTQPGLLNQQPNVNQPTNQIMDITKINTSAGAKLWMLVNRTGFPGTQKVGHEVLAFDDPMAPPVALDSWAERTPYDVFADGNLRYDDVDELTDQSVNTVVKHVDPFTGTESYTVHPNTTVIAGVSSPLENWVESGDIVYVGLFYDNEFELLAREGVSNRGTAQVSKRRWNRVYARLDQSAVPLINDEAPRDRTPGSLMGTAEPFFAGDVEYIELGSNDEGQLNIKQDRPLQTEILTLFGKLTSTEV
jgi:hypothetical protein